MKAGVSTACLYPKPLEESLYELTLNGIQTVEIFVNTHSELKKNFAYGILENLRRFDARCVSVHPFTSEMETMMFFSEYERRMDDILEYYKHFFQFMNIVGAEIFVFHGGKGGKTFSRELFCQRYQRLFELGKEFGVTVALENVARCLSSSSAFIRDISSMLGSGFAFVLDTKQALRSKENPFSFLDAAGSKTKHVHISDSSEMGDCLPIGKGRFRIKEFLEKLYRLNPESSVILELYRSGFAGISDLTRSCNILSSMIGNISSDSE